MKYRLTLTTGVIFLAVNTTATILSPRKDHVKCIQPGEEATATWTQRDGLICQYTDLVGVNYKDPPKVQKPRDKDDHNCMGRCGEGCKGTSVGDTYTQDCLNHDMCTYFNDVDVNKMSGKKNKDCGDEYKHGVGDVGFGRFHCPKKNRKNPLKDSEDIVPGNPTCWYPGKESEAFEMEFGRKPGIGPFVAVTKSRTLTVGGHTLTGTTLTSTISMTVTDALPTSTIDY